MKDLKCPYCNHEQDIDTDNSENYLEDMIHNQQCSNCEKYFAFTTSISFYYTPNKADCLNGSEHKWDATHTFPKEYTEMRCDDCGESRKPTPEEMKVIMVEKHE